jgi:protein-disulfide isomerase
VIFLAAALAPVLFGQKPETKAQPASAAATELPSKATVESFLKHWFGYDPSIAPEVTDISPSPIPGMAQVLVSLGSANDRKNMLLYITPDQHHAIVGEVLPFGADPFAPARESIAQSKTGVARGPENSKLTFVEFSDLECPVCKQAQPTMDKLLADYPQARFVFQQFPLEQVHPWAFKAALYADCVGQESNAAFWKFVQSVYDDQLTIDPTNADGKLREKAAAAGAPADRTAGCVVNPETEQRVRESLALGKALDVHGTPTLFINGRRINNVLGMPYELLKDVVNWSEKDAK